MTEGEKDRVGTAQRVPEPQRIGRADGPIRERDHHEETIRVDVRSQANRVGRDRVLQASGQLLFCSAAILQ